MTNMTPPNTLASLISQNASQAAPVAPEQPAPQQSIPVPAQGAALQNDLGLGDFGAPPPAANAVSEPVAPASPQMQPATTPTATQQPSENRSFADHLRELDFPVPETTTDAALAAQIAQQLDESNAIRNQLAELKEAQLAQQLEQQQAQQEPTQPTQPTAPAVSSLPTKLSDDAQQLASIGMIYQDEKGTWAARNPALQSFADEHNQFAIHQQQVARRLVTDPDGFFAERVDNLGIARQDEVTQLKTELDSIREQLSNQRQAEAEAEMQGFLDNHRQELFVNGDLNQPTEFTKRYNAFADQVVRMSEGMGIQLDRTQIHSRTLEMLEAAGISMQPTQPAPQQPAPQQPYQNTQPAPQAMAPQPPATFMQQAADRSPHVPVNRLPLQEHPANQPNGYQAPTIRGGKPNLNAIIAHQQQNGVSH